MKIAIVVHNGVRHDARVIKQAQTLKAAGHYVHVFGLSANSHEKFCLDDGTPVQLVSRGKIDVLKFLEERGLAPSRENKVWASFTEQGRLVFECVREVMRPDVVHIHDHVCLTAATRYKDAFAVPLIWDAHEIYEDLAGLDDVRRIVNPRIIRENASLVTAFITLNESIARFYAGRYPELPSAVLIPNASRFSGVPVYDGRLHRAAGLESHQRILLFQGGFAENRGISTLLEVACQLDARWSVVFMGWGKLENSIRARASQLSDQASTHARVVVVPGAPQPELPLWTAGAALGAIPYEDTGLNHRYCTPNKLWEFPASGVPILATDLPEMASRIRAASMGLIVSANLDSAEIGCAINSLSDEDLVFYRQGAKRFIADDSWARYEPRLLSVYENLPNLRKGLRSIFRALGPRR
ncbi:glycosyltransferase family 4 protein [Brevibacterium sp.]|uniref:glycosyltransferase family 4 protein n=1 Tax=Brevibacterium sp. TaxID=1701 RepID=UPI002812733B|nr:glycosyltransferase family 4 protein [Brevibacterium sp.]